MQNFNDFGFHKDLELAIKSIGFTEPTPIQAQTIPLALEGHDILGSAQTGTGKTAAFALPVLQKLMEDDSANALILTPTRELGKQIMDNIHQFLGRGSNIRTAFIIGGEAYGKQMSQLRSRPRIIVGTPGRINDHLNRGSMDLDLTRFVVLDETDRMLDMGFTDQLERIFAHIPEERQTLMFSATMPKNIIEMSRKYLKNAKRVEVGASNVVAENLVQDIMRVPEEKKYDELVIELQARQGTKIIFVKTKFATERMAKRLRGDGYAAEAINGDLKQAKRSRVIKDFRAQNFDILVATDVVARGLDVPHVEHVINYNLPQVAEDYIHRIGRTARAGAKGHALCLVSPQEGRQWNAIVQLLDPDAKPDPRFAAFGDKKSGGKGRGKPRRSGGGKKQFGDSWSNDNRGGERKERSSDNRSERSQSWGNDKPASRPSRNDRFGGGQADGEKRANAYSDGGQQRPARSDGKPAFKKSYSRDNDERGDFKPAKKRFDNRRDGVAGGEKRPYNGEKKFSGEKKPYSGEKKPYTGEKKKFSGEKRDFNVDRNGPAKSGKPAYKGKHGEQSEQKRNDRPSKPFVKRAENGDKPFAKKPHRNGSSKPAPAGVTKNKPNVSKPGSRKFVDGNSPRFKKKA